VLMPHAPCTAPPSLRPHSRASLESTFASSHPRRKKNDRRMSCHRLPWRFRPSPTIDQSITRPEDGHRTPRRPFSMHCPAPIDGYPSSGAYHRPLLFLAASPPCQAALRARRPSLFSHAPCGAPPDCVVTTWRRGRASRSASR
jgi:hypothetical protein